MIVIKRNVSSSIKDNCIDEKITFGDFTITLSEVEYRELQAIMDDDGLKPLEALQVALEEGLWHLNIECD